MRKTFHSGIITTNLSAISQTITRITPTPRSQFSYTVRNNDYSLVYTVENNQLGLYKLTDLQQKDNLAAANPQVVKEMQGVVREFIDNSQPPLSEVNQEKFNKRNN